MNESKNSAMLAAIVAAALAGPVPGTPEIGAQPSASEVITDSPPLSSATQYAALWQATEEERRFRAGDSPAAIAAPRGLTARGFRLVDVEVWFESQERKYLGVYRPSEVSSVLVAGLDEQGLRRERMKQRTAGRCLIGFEAWQEGGESLYAGVWAPASCGSERLAIGLDGSAFQSRQHELEATHHLVDFETVRTAAGLELAGVWHAGAEDEWYLLQGLTWESFHDRVHQLTPDGLRLADIEIDRAGKQTYYSGFWRAGEGVDWLGVGYRRPGFEIAHDNLVSGKGFGLQSDPPAAGGGRWLAATPAPPATRPVRMKLVAVEVWGTRQSGIPSHGPPLHDSGTAGNP